MTNCWTSIGKQVIRMHTRDQVQDHTHRGLLIDKLDISIGRVAAGEKVPSLEKGLSSLRDGKNSVSISKFYFHSTRAVGGGRDQIKSLLT